jgi:hypothetical protein
MLDIPNECTAKIIKSHANDEWKSIQISVGYKVHPVPTPSSVTILLTTHAKPRKKSQKLILFNRGNTMSGKPTMTGA